MVIHDGFELKAWKDFMREDRYVNVVLDTHRYLMFAETEGCGQTLPDYLDYIRGHFAKDIEEMQQYLMLYAENGVFSTPWPAAVTQWEAGAC